ncbi:MAG: hypothetical protein UT48_C0001G0003 [Parcubacteria group bacterium GW2011_GWE2_39_37]|nr:MAG: hypothetical protein UT48_C0001G0003 [Parcubacteria group bacterium GW2011_GWE2_39_37]
MREFVMAEEKGLGEKLLNWRKKIDPHSEEVYKNMSEYAKNKIKGGKKPTQIDKDIDNMFKQSETYKTEYVEYIYLANIIEGEIGRHLFELFKNKDKKEYFAFENEANQIHDEFYKLTEEHKGQVISEADLAEVQKKLTAFAIKHNINPELLSLRKALYHFYNIFNCNSTKLNVGRWSFGY